MEGLGRGRTTSSKLPPAAAAGFRDATKWTSVEFVWVWVTLATKAALEFAELRKAASDDSMLSGMVAISVVVIVGSTVFALVVVLVGIVLFVVAGVLEDHDDGAD